MTIKMTLNEIHKKCNDWEAFCERHGLDVYAVNEGGDDIEVRIFLEEAKEFGIIETNQ